MIKLTTPETVNVGGVAKTCRYAYITNYDIMWRGAAARILVGKVESDDGPILKSDVFLIENGKPVKNARGQQVAVAGDHFFNMLNCMRTAEIGGNPYEWATNAGIKLENWLMSSGMVPGTYES